MNKIILICLLIGSALIGKSQTTYPIKQNVGNSPNTIVLTNAIKGKLINAVYMDTTSANAEGILKFYDGALIKTISPINAVFWRDSINSTWVQIIPAGSGGGGTFSWNQGGNNPVVADGAGNAVFGANSNNGISFKTNATSRFILGSTGIRPDTGTTSPIGVGADGYLHYTSGGGGAGWGLSGNALVGGEFLGSTNNFGLKFKANNIQSGYIDLINKNTSFGYESLLGNSSGNGNTAIGYRSMKNNSSGFENTALGYGSLTANTTGIDNAAFGVNALVANTTGGQNTAIGKNSLGTNTTASNNTAFGINSLYTNNGASNSGYGVSSLTANTTGEYNTAIGTRAGLTNTTGSYNSYFGDSTGLGITTGSSNTILGARVTGLSSGLTGNVILADGAGTIRQQYNNAGAVQFTSGGYGTAGQVLKSNGSGGQPYWADTTAGGGSVTPLSYVGDFLTTDFLGGSLPSDMTSTGATVVVNDGLTISGGDGSYSSNYARGTNATASINWRDSVNFVLNTAPINSSGGIYFGRLSGNATTTASLFVTTKRESSTTWRIVLRLMDGANTGTAVDSSAVITMTAGDSYRIIISSSNTFAFAKFQHIVAGVETEAAFINYKYLAIPPAATLLLPNTGYPVIGVLGNSGVYKVNDFNEYHYDYKNCDVTFLGTSISARYYAISSSQNYIPLIFQNTNKTYAVLAGGGDKLSEMNLRFKETKDLASRYVIIEAAPNDACGSVRADLIQLIDSIKNIPAIPAVLVIVANTCKDTVLTNVCREKSVLLMNVSPFLTSADYEDGSVHLNGSGANVVANYVKNNMPYLFGRTGGTETQALQNLNDVYTNTLANNDFLSYNSTTKKWNNKAISALNSSFIQNQTASFQSTGYAVNYGLIRYGLAVGTIAPSAYVHFIENTQTPTGVRFDNPSSSGSTKYGTIFQMGSTGYGVPGWSNSTILDAGENLVLSGYNNSIIFQTGNSRTTHMTLDGSGNLGIGGTANASAKLDVTSTTQGALFPRMTTTQKNAISSPAEGLVVYDLTIHKLCVFTGSVWETVTSL